MTKANVVPRHIAIIMDGNGRWARKRFLPRFAGHVKGVDALRTIVGECLKLGVEYLTLFAFSSENWQRPQEEVSLLMQLFTKALQQEVARLDRNQVRLRVVGDLQGFDAQIQSLVSEAENATAKHTKLNLTIAANYGGRWDITQAVNRCLADNVQGTNANSLQTADIEQRLALNFAPEPDLFIRTGGEQRISNFMLWQLAYTELYFTDTLWPEFGTAALHEAMASFTKRERRFGQTSEQVQAMKNA